MTSFSKGEILAKHNLFEKDTLHEKCSYSEFFWSVFSRIWTEYGEILSPNSVRMQENTDQENSEYGLFSPSDRFAKVSKATRALINQSINHFYPCAYWMRVLI